MNVFLKFMVGRGEKHLARYRVSAEALEAERAEEYQSWLPLITECYERAEYWHGTGHYHYYHPRDSRYAGVDHTRTVDVVQAIVDRQGLEAHTDLWYKADGHFLKTISLAPSRMHARLYAHIHLREGVWLDYVFGGTRFWMGFFVFYAGMELFSLKRGPRMFLKQTLFNPHMMRHARTWASAIRNLHEYKILPLWRAYDLRSDIAGNHPVLFGIKKNAVIGDGVMPFLRKIEVRVTGRIPLEQLTHLEVPKEHVSSVKKLLDGHGISLPVIPLEFGELYCSKIPLAKLAYV